MERRNEAYLPNIPLEENLIPKSGQLDETLANSHVIIFAVPNEYITDVCNQIISMKGILPNGVIAISLIKGLSFDSNGNFERISEVIQRSLCIPTGVLSGANVANEVAEKQYCEATLCFSHEDDPNLTRENLNYLLRLCERDYFKITISNDQATVEICGALKNVIACGAGLIDGLGFGINTKSAAIGAGTREMIKFVELFHPNFQLETLFQSCGLPDILASSFGGRNRKVGEAFAKSRLQNIDESLEVIEARLLKGQKLQGPSTAKCVYQVLLKSGLADQFPFFTTVHKIFNGNQNPLTIFDAIRQC